MRAPAGPSSRALVALGLSGCQLVGGYDGFESSGGGSRPNAAETTGATTAASSGAASGAGGSDGSAPSSSAATEVTSTSSASGNGNGGAGAQGPAGGGGSSASGTGGEGGAPAECDHAAWTLGEPTEVFGHGYVHQLATGQGFVLASWWTADGPVVASFAADGTFVAEPAPFGRAMTSLVSLGEHGFAGASQDEDGAWLSFFDETGTWIEDLNVARDPVPWDVEVDPIAPEDRGHLWPRWTGSTLVIFDPETLAVATVEVEEHIATSWEPLAGAWRGGNSRNVHLMLDDEGASLLLYRDDGGPDPGPGDGLLAQRLDAAGDFVGAATPAPWILPSGHVAWSCGASCWVVVDDERWLRIRVEGERVVASEVPYPPGAVANQPFGGVVLDGCRVLFTACTDYEIDPPQDLTCSLLQAARNRTWIEELHVYGPPPPNETAVYPSVVAVTPQQLLVFETHNPLRVRTLTPGKR